MKKSVHHIVDRAIDSEKSHSSYHGRTASTLTPSQNNQLFKDAKRKQQEQNNV